MRRAPYCSNCGHSLVDLTESSKCPECGRPIVEVLTRDPFVLRGRRYKSNTLLFGLPLIHVALGPHEDEPYGKARGIIALGDIASAAIALLCALLVLLAYCRQRKLSSPGAPRPAPAQDSTA